MTWRVARLVEHLPKRHVDIFKLRSPALPLIVRKGRQKMVLARIVRSVKHHVVLRHKPSGEQLSQAWVIRYDLRTR